MTKGWRQESMRHSLARKGVKTGRKKRITVSGIRKIVSERYVTKEGFEFSCEPIEDSISLKETKDGYEARYLSQDLDAESPDAWGDDHLFLVNYHRDFDVRNDNVIKEDDARAFYQGEKIPQQKDYWIFPVEAYIHSGVSLTLTSFKGMLPQGHYEFDTSRVGLVLVSKKEIKSEKKAKKLAEGLVTQWNQYLSGDVYCINKETYNKNKKQKDHDVVCGFYGMKEAETEMKTMWK